MITDHIELETVPSDLGTLGGTNTGPQMLCHLNRTDQSGGLYSTQTLTAHIYPQTRTDGPARHMTTYAQMMTGYCDWAASMPSGTRGRIEPVQVTALAVMFSTSPT